MQSILTAIIFFLVLVPSTLQAEPVIQHFYPDQPVLLGQPFFWNVQIRHAMWESYDLKFGPCPDLNVSISDKILSEVAGEIRILYRISIVPTALKPSCAPTLTLSDQKGQTIVLNGKPLIVRTISGVSEELKEPKLPTIKSESSVRHVLLYGLLVVTVVLSLLTVAKRIYNNRPAQRFLRDLRKASTEVGKDRLPIQIWRLLRSPMLWGFQAEAYTPAQLSERASSDRRLELIAGTLQTLEAWRYSGTNARWDRGQVLRSLQEAEDLILSRKRFRRRRVA